MAKPDSWNQPQSYLDYVDTLTGGRMQTEASYPYTSKNEDCKQTEQGTYLESILFVQISILDKKTNFFARYLLLGLFWNPHLGKIRPIYCFGLIYAHKILIKNWLNLAIVFLPTFSALPHAKRANVVMYVCIAGSHSQNSFNESKVLLFNRYRTKGI
jgi:hypothetical protein